MASSKLRRYTSITERKTNLCRLKVIESVNDRFATAVDYRNYLLLKNLSRYDNDVV